MENEVIIRKHKHASTASLAVVKGSVDAKPATTVKIETAAGAATIASWGDDNMYPSNVLTAARKNSSASRGVSFLRKAHYGSGFVLMKDEVTSEGKKDPKKVPFLDQPEINDFLIRSNFWKFSLEIISDLEWFYICFPEYIVSENGENIVQVHRHRAAWCRFGIDEKGIINKVFISESFRRGRKDTEGDFVEEVTYIDPYMPFDQVKEMVKTKKIKKFIRPTMFPLIDEPYYPVAEWHSIIESGWLDVANAVPSLKRAIFNNQISIKYLIEIHEDYFEKIYGEQWRKYAPNERKQIREQLIDDINEALVGNDKAGKSIQSMMLTDSQGRQYSAVKITTIDDKLKDGSYLPEAEAANSEILVALGVDASLIGGSGIPGGNGSGSGSDKREAFTILQALKKSDREISLEPFNFIKLYNNWPPEVYGAFENTVLTTLDKNPTGTKQVVT
jgi:hypothetical protein